MREIKFRAWDSMFGMKKVTGIDFEKQIVKLLNEQQGESFEVNLGRIRLMQYTGLKDKNGKEIYKGDVVSAWSTGVKTIGEVKQRNDGMWFIYPPLWHFIPNSKGRDDVEIIGNIYENPELLKEANE